MPMTTAEKQKKYREKLKIENPEKYEEIKNKAKERSARHYQKKKSTYTEEDREKLRQKWKEDRKKAKGENNAPQNEPSTSQASSKQQRDDLFVPYNIQRRNERRLIRQNAELRLRLLKLENGFKSLQKKISRQQGKMYKMQEEYENLLAQLATKNKTEDMCMQEIDEMTPRKKVEEFINKTIPGIETPKKDEIKKKLLEHDILTLSLEEQFKRANNSEKKILKKVLDSDTIKKYKHKSKIRTYLGLKSNLKKYRNQKAKSSLLKHKIERFFNKDDVSRATAGKKEYRTFKKVKRQKRYLVDKLKTLHKKFLSEEGPISFSTFKKYRPWYVLSPKVKDCESCACIRHSNIQFMVDKLKFLNILKSDNLNEVVADFVCDFASKNCMYNKCDVCQEIKLCVDNEKLSDETTWFTWILKEHEYEKQGEKKKIKKMVKIRKDGTLKDLVETFNTELKKFKTHIFNFYYQYKKYKDCIDNLKDDEACIHIDFSENFTCKYHKEIQAMHFIKEQITLHTGVFYIKGEQKPISFCSVSPDNRHNPEAIWTHLDPVLQHIKMNHPNISTLHFFSDGPTTQYRQKKNFYFFSQKIYEYGFTYGTWSFFEAAHGKGAADGIGGVVKRTLDAKIAQGKDIPNAETAFEVLDSETTSIKIFYIPSIDVLPIHTKLSPLQQTMKIHQLITKEKFKLKHRDLSCFCGDPRGNCECHSPVHHSFLNEEEPNKQNKDKKRRNVKRSQNSKKTKLINPSSEESDSEIDIKYAESDDSVLFSDDAMNLDSDNDAATVHNLLSVDTVLFSDDAINPDRDNEPATVHNIIGEKTGILIKSNPNRKVTLLSQSIIKQADKRKTICENEDFIPKKSRKTTGHVPKHDHVIILSKIRNIPENTVSGDLKDSNIFRKLGPFNELRKTESDQLTTDDNKRRDANKENKNRTKEDTTETFKIEDKIENQYQSEKIRFDTRGEKMVIAIEKNEQNNEERDRKAIESAQTEHNDQEAEIKVIKSTENEQNHQEKGIHMTDSEEGDQNDLDKGKKTTESAQNAQEEGRKANVSETREIKMIESTENEEIHFNLNIKDSVIVRYYERKKWKYYVGFVETKECQNDENYYKVNFLKTGKDSNHIVKFLVQKKIDIDIVTAISIVKKVNLMQRETDSKVYYLQDDEDSVFFT